MEVAPGKRIGNWSSDGEAERARLRRDYLELDPAQRMKQVCDLSRFMSRVAEAGPSDLEDLERLRQARGSETAAPRAAPPSRAR